MPPYPLGYLEDLLPAIRWIEAIAIPNPRSLCGGLAVRTGTSGTKAYVIHSTYSPCTPSLCRDRVELRLYERVATRRGSLLRPLNQEEVVMMGQQEETVVGNALRSIRRVLALWGRTSVPFFKA
jgi:hypothetical protein